MVPEEGPRPLVKLDLGQRHYFMTSCHRIPERSFHFRGKPLLCYRCLGLNGGFFLFFTIQLVLTVISLSSDHSYHLLQPLEWISGDNRLITFLLIVATQLPFIIDGTIQAMVDRYTSNNPVRLVTGLLGGYGQFILIFFLGQITRSFL